MIRIRNVIKIANSKPTISEAVPFILLLVKFDFVITVHPKVLIRFNRGKNVETLLAILP